jgi:alkanesulfonate monooxygenase SsuD/methylene tetrahydromethanopterin reductase-like flavin-dependent oxidoreductase (luciferase family)
MRPAASTCLRSLRLWMRSRIGCRWCRALGGGPVRLQGEYFSAKSLDALPKSIQQPRPPLILGGRGGRGACAWLPLGGGVQHGDVDRDGDRRPAARTRSGLRSGGPRPGEPAALDDRPARWRRPQGPVRPRARLLRWKDQGGVGDTVPATLSEKTITETVAATLELEQAGLNRIIGQHLLRGDLGDVALRAKRSSPCWPARFQASRWT